MGAALPGYALHVAVDRRHVRVAALAPRRALPLQFGQRAIVPLLLSRLRGEYQRTRERRLDMPGPR